jgi:hypothetical protein
MVTYRVLDDDNPHMQVDAIAGVYILNCLWFREGTEVEI